MTSVLLNILVILILVSVIWNGTTIAGPVLIYQDELLVNDTGISALNSTGSLVCKFEKEKNIVGWRTPRSETVSTTPTGDFRQIRSPQHISRLLLNRAGVSRNDSASNGLWTCRLSGSLDYIFVGIYGRGGLQHAAVASYLKCNLCMLVCMY